MTYYFAQNATIEVREPNTARFKVVGAVQGVSIDTEFEVEEMYQFGSILRTTASRHHASVNVKVSSIQFGKFDEDPAWFWRVLNAAGITTESAGNESVHKISISDTTNLPMFSIGGKWISDDGTETIYARVDGVYFKNFSWGGNLGEYIIEELEGTGAMVVFTTNQQYASGGNVNVWAGDIPRIETSIESIVITKTSTEGSNVAKFNLKQAKSFSKVTVLSETPAVAGVTYTVPSGTSTVGTINVTGKSDGHTNIFIICDGLSKTIPVEVTGFSSFHSITLEKTACTAVSNPESAAKGTTVTITVTPDSGKTLTTVSSVPTVTFSGTGNTRTFQMPDANIVVTLKCT